MMDVYSRDWRELVDVVPSAEPARKEVEYEKVLTLVIGGCRVIIEVFITSLELSSSQGVNAIRYER